MRLRNRHGDPVDPVPFLVVVGFAFLLVYSFGPLYLMELFGVDILTSLAGSTVVFVGATIAAYYRFVVSDRGDLRGETPVDWRYRRLWYGGIAFALLLVLLMLPLVEL